MRGRSWRPPGQGTEAPETTAGAWIAGNAEAGDGAPPRLWALALSAAVLAALARELATGSLRSAPWALLAPAALALGLVWNFGVPAAYLAARRRAQPAAFRGLRALPAYASGVLGDGVLVPMLDVALVASLQAMPPREPTALAVGAVAIGALLTAALHAGQARYRLVNWSMPRPGRWNFAGQWHLVSAPAQFALLAYGLGAAFLAGPAALRGDAYALVVVGALAALFLATVVFDYRAELAAAARSAQEIMRRSRSPRAA